MQRPNSNSSRAASQGPDMIASRAPRPTAAIAHTAGQRVHWLACAAGLLAALAGCRAAAPGTPAAERPPAPAEAREALDASYDWHVLLVAPFGSVLKDVPLALHEVLLFRDEHGGAAQPAAGAAECYAADVPAPRFFANTPDEFLLCFQNDRLSRIEASVQVTVADARARFAAACAGWMKNAAAGGRAGDAQGPPAGAAAAPADGCEGREDAVHFNARLNEDSQTTVSMTLDSAPDP